MFNRTGLFLGALAFAAAFLASSETLAEEEVTATPVAVSVKNREFFNP